MAFRKRNIGIGGSARGEDQPSTNKAQTPTQNVPGVRPSPLTGQATTSTGTWSLDNLLGGHAGLPLGSLLLIEESGTTDFAGALLRFFAAEGVVQNQSVHVVGVGEQWTKELPGMIGAADSSTDAKQSSRVKVDEEKMKIAWRYERLGQHDANRPGRGVFSSIVILAIQIYHSLFVLMFSLCSNTESRGADVLHRTQNRC